MLNSIINIDLHIHSKASAYKESAGFVNNSSIENLDVLFNKLQENDINLFSITDHNRFDVELYEKALELIESGKYPAVKGILSGVEFDVVLEDGMNPCHIITIFDAKTKEERERIKKAIDKDMLETSGESYDKKRYESILKEIGLNTILIVHQKQSLDRFDKSHRSLSGSTRDPYRIIEFGYINALEYHKSSVEGILKNNLKKIKREVPLFAGSDCHQWEFYPKHNETAKMWIDNFTNMKSLPSFRGLLFALTSPNTRMNKIEKTIKDSFIQSFELDSEPVYLDYGVNAIIGENGSGKSTLMKLLNGVTKPAYVNGIREKSKLVFDKTFEESKTLIVNQSEIVDKFNSDELFDGSLYKEVDHFDFESGYKEFDSKLKKFIVHNIEVNETFEKLLTTKAIIDPEKEIGTYYVQIESTDLEEENLGDILDRKNSLKNIIKTIIIELNKNFYSLSQKKLLTAAYKTMYELYQEIIEQYYNLFIINKLKQIIISASSDYQAGITASQTSLDSSISAYKKEKNEVKNCLLSYLLKKNEKVNKPASVRIVKGISDNHKNGFTFRRITRYSGMAVEDKYMKKLFVNQYQSLNSIDNIKKWGELKEALLGCTSVNRIDVIWKNNFEKFLEEMKKSEEFIMEAGSDVKEGRTLGQISLTYYKYHLNAENTAEVVCVDQPEDNLSNSLIQNKLITYLNALRDTRQLIIVTHNPLLVVNLDADNVIKVEMKNGKLKTVDGCLEDDSNGILKYIAENMDGGKESIERRYKLYE